MRPDQLPLLVQLGAVRSSRAALSANPNHLVPPPYADRIERLDDELRKLARDIARDLGL